MKLESILVLRGINIYARESVTCLILELGGLPEQLPEDFIARLGARLPLALDDAAQERLRAGATAADQVCAAVRVAVERLHKALHVNLDFTDARPCPPESTTPGRHAVLYSVEYPQFSRAVGQLAVAQVAAAASVNDPRVTLATELQKLQAFIDDQLPMRARRELLTRARRSGIPVHRYGVKPDILHFGHGRWQKRTNLTITDTTSAVCSRITSDKRLANRMLRRFSIPVAKQSIVDSVAEAERAAKSIGFPVVLKPRSGNRGRGVTANLKTIKEVRAAYKRARAIHRKVLVESHLPGDTHRFSVIHGRVVSVVRRVPPHVIGDGQRSIAQLIEWTNARRIRPDGLPRNLRVLRLDEETTRVLKKARRSPRDVPKQGEFVRLGSIDNGGTVVDVSDTVHPDNAAAAIRAVELMRIDAGGVDFLLPDPAKSYKETGGGMAEVNYMPDILIHLMAEGAHKSDFLGAFVASLFPDPESARLDSAVVLGPNRGLDTINLEVELRASGRRPASVSPRGVRSDGWLASREVPKHWFHASHRALYDPIADTSILAPSVRTLYEVGLCDERCDVLGLRGALNLERGGALAVQALIDQAARVVVQLDKDRSYALEIPAEKLVLVGPGDDERVTQHLERGGRALVGSVDTGYRWNGEGEPVTPRDGGQAPVEGLPIAMAEELRRRPPRATHRHPYQREP